MDISIPSLTPVMSFADSKFHFRSFYTGRFLAQPGMRASIHITMTLSTINVAENMC
uniref:Uncharacterized protein n=1 Tax=Rhizophora mucronata TaxID=61149 RepID=A0A2P2Q866_RHIMU